MNPRESRRTEALSQQSPTQQGSSEGIRKKYQHQESRPDRTAPADWSTNAVLDSTNNRLQELMQLLYLLSRDPAVPTDARYHVTLAQSEIALLARLLQNSADEQGVKASAPAATHPA